MTDELATGGIDESVIEVLSPCFIFDSSALSKQRAIIYVDRIVITKLKQHRAATPNGIPERELAEDDPLLDPAPLCVPIEPLKNVCVPFCFQDQKLHALQGCGELIVGQYPSIDGLHILFHLPFIILTDANSKDNGPQCGNVHISQRGSFQKNRMASTQ